QLDHARFVGVHTGHLGFYTDWTVDELDQFIDFLLNDSGESVSYPLLEVALEKVDGEKNHLIALNEATLRRFEGTMTGEVFIKEEKFEL
ncbi:NAD kinase, partial [Aerococcus sp. UMB9870]|nr:NAD kinase [Aerococcus sp. UMB9870]